MNGEFVVRAAKALIIFIIIAAILLGVAWYVTGSFDSASQQLRARFEDSPDPSLSVMRLLEGARYQLMQWIIASGVIGWLCASIFLMRAQQHPASSKEQGGQRLVSWIVMLAISTVYVGGAWYLLVSNEGVAGLLLSDGYMMTVALTFILLPFAYWLATGLAVKGVMRPSVPLSGLLPRLWS